MVHLITVVCAVTGALTDDPPTPVSKALEEHQGTWRVVSFQRDGMKTPDELARSIVRVVEKDHVVWKREGKSFAGTKLVLDPSADPKRIDVIPDGGRDFGKHVLGIYKQDGDDLTICMADADAPRPTKFEAGEGTKWTLMTFRREKEVREDR